jgi:hypothetical protein
VFKDRLGYDARIMVRNRDMLEFESCIRSSPIRFKYVTFMRSISNLQEEQVVWLLSSLRKYGVNVVMIVTMVRDLVKDIVIEGNTLVSR